MRWIQRRVPEPDERQLARAEEVARILENAADEAPPSPNAERIRMALMEDAGAGRGMAPGLGTLALATAVLGFAIVVAIGGPAVGTLVDQLVDRSASPSPPSAPEVITSDDTPKPLRSPVPATDAPPQASNAPARASASPTPGVESTDQPTPTPTATPTATATQIPGSSGPPEHVSPSGPPSPMPTPPRTGPPPGVP